MATLQLTLPDQLKAAAEARAAEGGFGSVDGYIASLIQADELGPLTDVEENELLRGLDSGAPVDITPEFLGDLKARVRGLSAGHK